MKCNRKISPYKRAQQLRKNYKLMKTEYRDSQYQLVQDTAINALNMERNKQELQKFIKDKFWVGCKNPPRNGQNEPLLRHLLRFVYGKGDNQRKRAWRHANRVNFLCSIGVKEENLMNEINARGGWKGVDNEQKQSKIKSAGAKISSSPKRRKSNKNGSISQQCSKKSKCNSSVTIQVEIEVANKDFQRLMRVPKGKSISADIVCQGREDDGYVIFHAESIDFS